jgi:hypothetical protein
VNPRPAYVSVIDPIGPAIERVKTVLFRPFDLGKWFVIGFSAWLAQLGSGGGSNNSGGKEDRGGGVQKWQDLPDEARHAFEQAKDYVLANLHWIVPVAIGVFIVLVTVTLLVTWLSSRGRFTFLYCVAQDKGEFWNPWRQFGRHGNNLFAFRITLAIIGFLTAVAFLTLGGVLAFFSYQTIGFSVFTILGLVMCGLLLVATMIVFGTISLFTTDFVVPIMYQHGYRCTKAWKVLLELLGHNQGRFILYLLFQLVIGIAIGTIALMTMCFCCLLCCLCMIPYIGTVLLLPLIVFKRSYSLYYLAQYGPDFNVFPPEPEVVTSDPQWQS